MEKLILWLALLIIGVASLYIMALRIPDGKKRRHYMMGTHLATVVPASVGIGNYLFPPDHLMNGILSVLVVIGIVLIVWIWLRRVFIKCIKA